MRNRSDMTKWKDSCIITLESDIVTGTKCGTSHQLPRKRSLAEMVAPKLTIPLVSGEEQRTKLMVVPLLEETDECGCELVLVDSYNEIGLYLPFAICHSLGWSGFSSSEKMHE